MKSIAFLIYDERLTNGIIKTQVLNIAQHYDHKTFVLYICQMPVILYHYNAIKRLVKKFNNIKFIFIPVALPSRYVLYNSFLLDFVESYLSQTIRILYKYLKFDVVHCRSYFSSHIAVKSGIRSRIICDLRSLFIEENESLGLLKKGSRLYRKWVNMLIDLNSNENIIIAINEEMKNKLVQKYGLDSTKIYILPLVYDPNEFELDNNNKRTYTNSKFIYIGSIGKHLWNNYDVYANYISQIKNADNGAKFIFISQKISKEAINVLTKAARDDIEFIKNPPREFLVDKLKESDYGLIFMTESLDSDTRLAVKTIEYLAAGLAVITNKNAGSAASIIENEELGIVVDKVISRSELEYLKNNSVKFHEKAQNYARAHFSIECYLNKYREIID